MAGLSARQHRHDSRLRQAAFADAATVARVDRTVAASAQAGSNHRSIAAADPCRTDSDGRSQPAVARRRRQRKSTPEKACRLRKFGGSVVLNAYREEVSSARLAMQCGNYERCFVHLERAHVLAQRMTIRHTYVHWLMLVAGLRRRDYREALGQVPRMLASVLFSRLWVPRGNTGRARVSALQPMPVPEDLRDLIS
jgi:Protein of unknown function (DUF3703)